jgi:hypothetical protein
MQDAFVKKVLDVTASFFFVWRAFPRFVLGVGATDKVEV